MWGKNRDKVRENSEGRTAKKWEKALWEEGRTARMRKPYVDRECNETGGMNHGTFVALNRNPQLYLRNNKTFDKVKGEIADGTIVIDCENTKDKIEVNWMVIAERQDDNIKQSLLTNNEGNLICEKTRLQ